MFARTMAALLAVGMLALTGCGPAKLDESKTYTMEAGDARSLDPPAQSKPQTLTVEFESSAAAIDVYVFKASDAPKDDDIATAPASKAIASKKGEKKGSFTADVPENTATRVVLRGAAGKTEVKLHVTNK